MTRDELIEKLKAIDFDHEVVLADQIGRRMEIVSVKRVDSAPLIEIDKALRSAPTADAERKKESGI